MFAQLTGFVADESGHSTQEYALIAAIMAVAIPTAISLVADDIIATVRAILDRSSSPRD